MIRQADSDKRTLRTECLEVDFAVAGGGLAGACAAITAARQGLKVVLVQDRPVLGGNSSSEIRLWVLGATSHMGNNNRWAREGGVIDEILVENTYCNPEGNPAIFDMVLLDKVVAEPNIRLLLNTAVYDLEKSGTDSISVMHGFCSQNSTRYSIKAPLFCDASGDGVLGFLSGAAFRMGAEKKEEFGEKFAPSAEYGELLGHSLYFYTKDTGQKVKFIPPSFALNDITKIPRFRSFNSNDHGCRLWWIEYGGRLDTVHDTEKIKWELWKVVYGVWNHIKNSGQFPEAETLTLDWVGTIPGKRESRRFEGAYMLRQQDIVEQRFFEDAVAFGGWSIDLHPADGVYSEKPGCNQWHPIGVYQIPYRCYYSHNIKNLFLAGRIISASHVAFGSSRVMATSAYGAQAVGMAAVICNKKNCLPADLLQQELISLLQKELQKNGQHIPGYAYQDEQELVQAATISASSNLYLEDLPEKNMLRPLDIPVAQLIPLPAGKLPLFIFHVEADNHTKLQVELRISSKSNNHTPDITLDRQIIQIHPGRNCLQIQFAAELERAAYVFVTFLANPAIKLHYSPRRITGILSVFNTINKAVSNYGKQVPVGDIGVDEFEFWCPLRRPGGHNIAFKSIPGIDAFQPLNIRNGTDRPVNKPNAWVADWNDNNPQLIIEWGNVQHIREIHLIFDTDHDHPMESVLMSHPETVMPFCVRNYRIKDDKGTVIVERKDNYQTLNRIVLPATLITKKLVIEVEHPSGEVPAAIFAVRCYH